jgi:hypothetical protein
MKDFQHHKNKKENLFAFCDYQKKEVRDYLRRKISLTMNKQRAKADSEIKFEKTKWENT